MTTSKLGLCTEEELREILLTTDGKGKKAKAEALERLIALAVRRALQECNA